MEILLMVDDEVFSEELMDIGEGTDVNLHFTKSFDEAFDILARGRIDKVLFKLRTWFDLEFLKYINSMHPDIEVILTANEKLHEIADVLKNGKYRIFPIQYKVRDLRTVVNSNSDGAAL